MTSLSCDVKLSLLFTLLVGDVAEGDYDEQYYDGAHADADVDKLIVDILVGFTCKAKEVEDGDSLKWMNGWD